MYLFHVQVDGVESKEELMKQFDANGDGVLTKEEPLRCGYFGRHRWLENPPLSSMIVPAIIGYKPPSLGFFSIATFDWRVNGKTMGQYIKIIRETHHRNAVHFDGENAGRSLYSRYPIFRQTQVYSFQSQLLYCQGEAGVREREVFLSVPIPAAIPWLKQLLLVLSYSVVTVECRAGSCTQNTTFVYPHSLYDRGPKHCHI